MNERGPDYIEFRLREAVENLDGAELLLQNGFLRDAVSRLYYGCFHAVEGLLWTEGLRSGKHSGVRSLFDRHWILSARLPRQMGRFYHEILDCRQRADYEVAEFDVRKAEAWLVEARNFVEALTVEAHRKLDERPPTT